MISWRVQFYECWRTLSNSAVPARLGGEVSDVGAGFVTPVGESQHAETKGEEERSNLHGWWGEGTVGVVTRL